MPRNKYPEETVQKILDTSLKLFIEKGYENTTVLDIVNNLGGLTRGAFYHHFKSKEEVLDAISEKLFYESTQFQEILVKKGLKGLEKIKVIFLAQLDGMVQNNDYRKLQQMNLSLLENPRFLVEHIKNNQVTAHKYISPIIKEGMEDGSIRPGDSKVLADLVMLLINFWLFPNIYPCKREEFCEKIDTIKQILDSLGFYVFDDEIMKKVSILADVFRIQL